MARSLRASMQRVYGTDARPEEGIRRHCGSFRRSRDLFERIGAGKHLDWPAGGIVPLEDYPRNPSGSWNSFLQGVTHDHLHWFFSQEIGRLWKIPLGMELHSFHEWSDAAHVADLPTQLVDYGFTHLGDIDYVDSERIVVGALEHVDQAKQPRVVAWDSESLEFLGFATLTEQSGSGPWCAVSPADGLLYSCPFYGFDQSEPVTLRAYELALRPLSREPVLRFVGLAPLFDEGGTPLMASNIQGGVFASSGRLYLAAQWADRTGDGVGGIMGFDMISGRRVTAHRVDYHPARKNIGAPEYVVATAVGGPAAAAILGLWGDKVEEAFDYVTAQSDELEGLTIWNMPAARRALVDSGRPVFMDEVGQPLHRTPDGDMHLIVLGGGTRFFFKHYWSGEAKDE